MQSSINYLLKIFRHEASLGFGDNAIIGGLEKMLDRWVPDARNEGLAEGSIQAVVSCLKKYHGLGPQQRRQSLKDLWSIIKPDEPSVNGSPENNFDPQELNTSVPQTPAKQEHVHPSLPPKQANQEAPRTQNPPRSNSQPGAVTSKTPVALNASLTVLNGIGPHNAKDLARLGLQTLGDLLYYFPRRYDDYSQLKPIHKLWYGDVVTVVGTVQSVIARTAGPKKLSIVEVIINDGTGALRLTWFNRPWLENRFRKNDAISVSGKIDQYLGRLVMNSPDWEPVEVESLHTNRIVPVYPSTSQITQNKLRKLIKPVVSYWAPKLTDHMPASIVEAADLPDLKTTLLQVHFPDTQGQLKIARERLAFDEIFFLQMGVFRQKRNWQEVTAIVYDVSDEWMETHLAELPFTLTGAQKQAISDIRNDLRSGRPMNRLLQGDVGSGKTVVAGIASMIVNRSGAQAAIMAPTSILADQHYRNFSAICTSSEGKPDSLRSEQVRLLVSDTPEKDKQEIRELLADGTIKLLVGTHALLEDPINFNNLQLAVIDEQHRFGVEQRAILRSKGNNPHLLVMTATPIPRSLALTVYGDLDLSIMDELPPGRQEIHTHVLLPRERERAYSLIRSQVEAGHQVFIVYPLVEESEKSELLAASEEHDRLQKEVFPKLKLGLLHGRMRPEEKDAVMLQFRNGEYQVLVSTTVVEVGVDIPNATVMLIEGANRFGLAQLHQLRGRVGRGDSQSYCLLIPEHEDAVENERLNAMTETNDGFILAERDLQLRGPGDFLGTRQAGYANLRMASLTDIHIIEKARTQAQSLFARDADLRLPENQLLSEALERFWGGGKGDIS
jgi:ATP-dependent DNA helicase RecG